MHSLMIHRSITTPYRLPWFNPVYSLRVLLTPTERRKPWIIYFTPGLFAAQFLHLAYKIIFIGSLRRLLLPSLPIGEDGRIGDISFWKLGIMLAIGLVSTVILCPLEVIASKLAIQRNHAAPEYNSVAQEVEDDALNNEEYAEYSGAEEDVIGSVEFSYHLGTVADHVMHNRLRHEKDPYLGLIDCAKKVVDEEGWQALYRAWWLTALSGLANALG